MRKRRHPLSPRNSSRPNQERQNNRPNNTPADPRDVRVSHLPFENFIMNGHQESCHSLFRANFQSNLMSAAPSLTSLE